MKKKFTSSPTPPNLLKEGLLAHTSWGAVPPSGGQEVARVFLLLLFISNFSFAQNPLVKQWDYRYGGTSSDEFTCLHQTKDGGYVLGGYSESDSSGDKTQPSWGGFDYWIVKIDSLGVKQWDKRFGGTTDNNYLTCLQQTADRGYILGGYTGSEIGGDKTQPSWGGYDYWIVKVDSVGTKQWDKRFGGTNADWLYSLQQTTDGGYILGGFTLSGIGGDITQSSWGGYDYWIVKTDSLGVIQWDKRFGGIDNDRLQSLQQTTDGGYILGGFSYSGISGDKTQSSWGVCDYWIVKIDSFGVMQWDKCFGGTNSDYLFSLQQTSDNGCILGGISDSDSSGDKSQPSWGGLDYWIVKIDSIGTKQWDKRFGGTDHEIEFGNITQTNDGGCLIVGTSYSPISGDKTENNLGVQQIWAVKTDSLGIKQWDKTILTNGQYERGLAIQSKDGCFLMANYTTAGIGGDKTQVSWGSSDYWIAKFCDTTTILSFIASDSKLCEKFCTSFQDQSLNVDAISWLWYFPGGDPSSSTDQNPTNICYNTPGTYDVTLITTNANGSDTLTLHNYITVYPTPPIPTITQVGYTLTSSPASSYQWQLNAVDIAGATNQSYTILQTGYYTVVVGDSNSCKNSTTEYVLISGIDDVMSYAGISIYPNPSSGSFTVELLQSKNSGEVPPYCGIEVVNMLGQKVFSSTEKISNSDFSEGVRMDKKEIDLHEAASGVYFIEISLWIPSGKTQNTSIRKKIIVSH